jgi:hypothetical protein
MKQTAVEFLVKEISDILGVIKIEPIKDLLLVDAINKAKEMEEQNTIEILERYHNSLFNILLKEGEAKEILKHIKKEL